MTTNSITAEQWADTITVATVYGQATISYHKAEPAYVDIFGNSRMAVPSRFIARITEPGSRFEGMTGGGVGRTTALADLYAKIGERQATIDLDGF